MAYVGQARGARLIAELSALGLGEMTVRGELPPRRSPWAFDNGAFGDWRAGRSFDGAAFRAALLRLSHVGTPPDFIVLPDIVAGGAESLAFSASWIGSLQRFGVPLYLAVQDGMEPADLGDVLPCIGGVFVGGSLPWKLCEAGRWCAFAHANGLPCHIGRVGTGRRVIWARRIGADSIDSSLPLFSRENLNSFVRALTSPLSLELFENEFVEIG
jgi:hypothetical protein